MIYFALWLCYFAMCLYSIATFITNAHAQKAIAGSVATPTILRTATAVIWSVSPVKDTRQPQSVAARNTSKASFASVCGIVVYFTISTIAVLTCCAFIVLRVWLLENTRGAYHYAPRGNFRIAAYLFSSLFCSSVFGVFASVLFAGVSGAAAALSLCTKSPPVAALYSITAPNFARSFSASSRLANIRQKQSVCEYSPSFAPIVANNRAKKGRFSLASSGSSPFSLSCKASEQPANIAQAARVRGFVHAKSSFSELARPTKVSTFSANTLLRNFGSYCKRWPASLPKEIITPSVVCTAGHVTARPPISAVCGARVVGRISYTLPTVNFSLPPPPN